MLHVDAFLDQGAVERFPALDRERREPEPVEQPTIPAHSFGNIYLAKRLICSVFPDGIKGEIRLSREDVVGPRDDTQQRTFNCTIYCSALGLPIHDLPPSGRLETVVELAMLTIKAAVRDWKQAVQKHLDDDGVPHAALSSLTLDELLAEGLLPSVAANRIEADWAASCRKAGVTY